MNRTDAANSIPKISDTKLQAVLNIIDKYIFSCIFTWNALLQCVNILDVKIFVEVSAEKYFSDKKVSFS